MRFLLGCVLALVPTIVHADTTAPEQQDATTALTESAIPTVAGIGALVAGNLLIANSTNVHDQAPAGVAIAALGAVTLIAGPALGHAHARDSWTTGVVTRGAAAVAASVGLYLLDACVDTFDLNLSTGQATCQSKVGGEVGLGLYAAGAIVLVASAIHDVATAPAAARRTAHERGIVALPAIVPVSAANGTMPALGAVGRF
jgi:hypothetical protein